MNSSTLLWLGLLAAWALARAQAGKQPAAAPAASSMAALTKGLQKY